MEGRIVAVTGGAGTLGRAVVKALAAAGVSPVAIDIAEQFEAPGAALTIGGVDSADLQAAQKAVETIRTTFGAIHGLVNIAGGFRWDTVLEGSLESWDTMYRTNLRTTIAMSRAAAPALLADGGAIVNVGAAAAARAALGMGSYAASKAGVARLTEAMAEELKDRNVRVNAVLPSIIDTPANRKDMPDADFDRWVKPEALASVVLVLLSDTASAITGALVPVTGRV